MKHVVFYSGGLGSWATAMRIRETIPNKDILLLFTDTLMEDEDLYRFLEETSSSMGIELLTIADGRTPWQIFKDEQFLGNSRVDPCSKILKRNIARRWIKKNYKPEDCILYLGIEWSEIHRWERAKEKWLPYTMKAPLCEPPYLDKLQIIKALKSEGIGIPRLYQMGFPHNNCGGFCIKAGLSHFRLLLKEMPERYRYHEKKEEELREFFGKDVTILRRQRNGEREYITLKAFRESIEKEPKQPELFDWGGCGCFL